MADLVLLVDDNPQNLQVLGQTLQNSDYEIAMALSGKEALRFLEDENPDIILLDVMMPEMNGYDVCKKLKENDKWKNIPVIFLTAKTEVDDIVAGFDAGGVDYISKPFNSRELIARVKTHIELKNAREEIYNLRGIIPVCASCHKVRDDNGYWDQVERYISKHSHAQFSHSVCPDCIEKLYPEYAKDINNGLGT